MDIILKVPDRAHLLEINWHDKWHTVEEGAAVMMPHDGQIIDLIREEKPEEVKVIYCKDCRRRSVDCPLSVWAGPHDDDFCSRAEPKEERDK